MRINLPSNTPREVVQCIRAVARTERLFNAHFPKTVSISTRNPRGVAHLSGKGSDCVAAKQFFAWAVAELRERGALN